MNKSALFIFLITFALPYFTNAALADGSANVLVLQADNFEHIEFRRIKSNRHSFDDQQLKIEVDNSASFLMKPFDEVRKVTRISFSWKSEGAPKIKNAEHEKSRPGDDAVFKLGLLLQAEEALSNPFLPSWMKRVEKLLKFPSENMLYLVADAKHAQGEQWLNPYNDRITMISMHSANEGQGWRRASYDFEIPLNVVAVWLMSDGDNTDSSFTSHVKNIIIE